MDHTWLSVLSLPAVLRVPSLLPNLKRERIHKLHPHYRNQRTGHLPTIYDLTRLRLA